jgi:hypothetical protein
MGAVIRQLEERLASLVLAVEWVDDAFEEARQLLIDGAVVSVVLVASIVLLPYLGGGGLIVGLAIIGIVQAADLIGRTGRSLAGLVRRALPHALHE